MPAVSAATYQVLSTGSPVDDSHRLASYDTSLVVSGGVDCGRRRRNVYDKKPQRYAKHNRTEHLTARSDKSVAYVTNNKDSTFCTVEANYWLIKSIARPLCDSRATCTFSNRTQKFSPRISAIPVIWPEWSWGERAPLCSHGYANTICLYVIQIVHQSRSCLNTIVIVIIAPARLYWTAANDCSGPCRIRRRQLSTARHT